jgi:heparosan-N-sulfate-glucuronate 5-epimerase
MSRSFGVGPGRHADPAAVRGYPVDFTAKATQSHAWPGFAAEPGRWLWVALIQWALGAYERWLDGDGEEWLAGAGDAAGLLVEHQAGDGVRNGAWIQTAPYPHTFDLAPPWVSGMAQGEGASLLVRMHLETGEDRYAEAARRALRPLAVQSSEGGASAALDSGALPEEYPTEPPSLVLNGAIFGLWGLRDVGVALGDADASTAFGAGVDALAENVDRWDTGFWSRYDLFPHAVTNVASPAYHALHVLQLEATHGLAPRPQLADAAARFARYAASPALRARAFAAKALFRLAVPRSRRLAGVLPWSRP